MNFFESELRKIFETGAPVIDQRFVGRACIGRLSDTTNAKLEFVTLNTSEKYEGIKATILNRNEGMIDSQLFRFEDILGKKPGKTASYSDGVPPHIWVYNGKAEWYSYKPITADYKAIAGAVNGYLEMFREPLQRERKAEKTSVLDTISEGRKAPARTTEKSGKAKKRSEMEDVK